MAEPARPPTAGDRPFNALQVLGRAGLALRDEHRILVAGRPVRAGQVGGRSSVAVAHAEANDGVGQRLGTFVLLKPPPQRGQTLI